MLHFEGMLGISLCRSQVDFLYNKTLAMHSFIDAFGGMPNQHLMDVEFSGQSSKKSLRRSLGYARMEDYDQWVKAFRGMLCAN